MTGAKSILDSLMGGLSDLTKGQGVGQSVSGLTQTAKSAWDGQSSLAKGAIAGGLFGVLMSGNARRLLGTGVKIGGAALIGGLAMRAYENWKSGKSADTTEAGAGPVALPRPDGTAFLPSDSAEAEDLAERILQAMVAAAKADGSVTDDERSKINAQLTQMGLGSEAAAMIAAELEAPLDVGRIAALARNEQEAVSLYTASLLVVDPDGASEKGYLAMLAARMGLDPGLVTHLHAGAQNLA